jgi:phosphoacetylglucosamine mutase
LATLRSRLLGKCIGVMVTASHNPNGDNGVKLVEPHGEMLIASWETHATNLANAQDVVKALESIIVAEKIPSVGGDVIVARDTRSTGPALVSSLIDGVKSIGGQVTDYGIFTTPQLHYLTRCLNTLNQKDTYGFPSEAGYYVKLAEAYKAMTKGTRMGSVLHVDCANGVGAPKLKALLEYLNYPEKTIEIVAHNTNIADSTVLNKDCGADFVKVNKMVPEGWSVPAQSRCCSLDGDADRLIFFFSDPVFHMLDGDKIATLLTKFISDQLKTLGVDLKVGVVQTAYANGSSTRFVKEILKQPVVMVPTGVKHLHHAAESFDVGVYFEANGHGTVLFSEEYREKLKSLNVSGEKEKAKNALLGLAELINQSVGDAISDMLAVDAVLRYLNLSFEEWLSMYGDVPNRLEKVMVKDRLAFKTFNAETQLSAPPGLQGKIDAAVSKFKQGRCFVRYSFLAITN